MLGEAVETAWRQRDYDESALPEIAARLLAEHDLPSQFEPWDVLRWALAQDELIRQEDPGANFGEPPVTVYQGARFHIDVYFWFTSTTSVHQHGFSGAFQVFAGSSIHSWYEFEPDDSVNVFMQFGSMRLRLCQLLQKGDVQEIRSGREYIHSLFHLEEPSVTIVVRTKKSPLSLPQYSYEKPCVAVDPFFAHETLTRKLQSAGALLRSKHPEADAIISQLLARSDIHSTYFLLSRIRPMLKANEVEKMFNVDKSQRRFAAFMEVVRERHGKRGERIETAFAHAERNAAIIARRAYVSDPDLRFFLAALLNVEGRENIYNLIRQRHPEADPLEKVLDWTFDLANTRITQLDPPNALGIADFGDVEVLLLEEMLRGKEAAAAVSAAQQQGVAAADLGERFETIRGSMLLTGLFV